jgi:hypothetical protein
VKTSISSISLRSLAACLFTSALVVVACDTAKLKNSQLMTDTAATKSFDALSAPADFSRRSAALTPEATAQVGVAGGNANEQQLPPVVAPDAMVIRNGHVTIEVDSLEIAIDRVRQLAGSLGGYLGNVSMLTGAHQVRTASLEMKIPAARFDTAMVGMPTLGKVEQSVSSAQDVGEEFVDVNARVANAKRLEARLIALLNTRTGRLSDVIAVERELARVRQEIERYEGRIRYLSTRVATSTIVATVHEKVPLIAQPGTNVFGRAFVNMWRNFVSLLTATIELAGVFVPLGLIGWGAFLGWKRWRRGRVVVAA